ncbi:unnamed protein product [Cochlearia groenlandica]
MRRLDFHRGRIPIYQKPLKKATSHGITDLGVKPQKVTMKVNHHYKRPPHTTVTKNCRCQYTKLEDLKVKISRNKVVNEAKEAFDTEAKASHQCNTSHQC